MTPEELRKLIESTGLSQARFAEHIDTPLRTVEMWLKQGVPKLKAIGLQCVIKRGLKPQAWE